MNDLHTAAENATCFRPSNPATTLLGRTIEFLLTRVLDRRERNAEESRLLNEQVNRNRCN